MITSRGGGAPRVWAGEHDLTKRPLLYTMEEAAELLRVSREFLYRQRRLGELAVVKLGRRTLVEASEIDRVIAASRMG